MLPLLRTDAEKIEMIFPTEPEWESVPDSALVELVERYPWELSCATTAIRLMARRKHERTLNLAYWLMLAPNTDQWLIEAATEAISVFEGRE